MELIVRSTEQTSQKSLDNQCKPLNREKSHVYLNRVKVLVIN